MCRVGNECGNYADPLEVINAPYSMVEHIIRTGILQVADAKVR